MSAERFPVEAGHIMMFARAIGDPNPVYHEGGDALGDGMRMIAPPTFVEASMHFDPAFPYRPRIGEPWFGSAAEPSSGRTPHPAAVGGKEGGTSFHAETRLEYHGILRPGEVLTVREGAGPSWEKEGSRGGRLWFSIIVSDFLRGDELVVRSTMVVVSTESKIEGEPAAEDGDLPIGDAAPSSRVPRPSRTMPSTDLGPASSTPSLGESRESTLVQNLSRAQILLYAAASGDFSPQHTDEVWNTRVAGYPSVFAHGMLTMGMTGRVLTDWFGVEALRTFDMRFIRQVWPGDDLIARVEIVALEDEDGAEEAELEIVTVNGRGETVAAGKATVRNAPTEPLNDRLRDASVVPSTPD